MWTAMSDRQDHLNKCVFCAHGITDDQGCRCGVSEILDDPETPTMILWALKAECSDAQERFDRRAHPLNSLLVPTVVG